ncbi:MAG: hypothetical protein ACTSW1_14265 [Candidatus Hodarchaeales archaeon]
MSKISFSLLKDLFRSYKTEIIIAILFSAPFILFLVFAFLKDNFLILDHSYWVGVIAYNFTIFVGIMIIVKKTEIRLSPVILYYAILLSLIILYAFQKIAFSGDITLGVIDGAQALWNGQNPYTTELIRHAIPHIPGEFRYTTYPYLPVDLLTYSLFLGIFNFLSSMIIEIPFFSLLLDLIDSILFPVVNILNQLLRIVDIFDLLPEIYTTGIRSFLPGFNAMGILLTNLLFMSISIFSIRRIFEIRLQQAIVLSLALFLALIWNNVCLAQMFFFIGWYFHTKEQTNWTIFFWSLSMLSKYFAGIFIVAYIIEYLLKKNYKEVILKSAIPSLLTLIFFLPFGISETLNSTVFFYNTEERLLDGSFGGSIFAELILFFNLTQVIWLFTLIGFTLILIIILLIKDLYQRLIIGSLTSLLVITGISAQFFPMIFFIMLYAKIILLFNSNKELKTVNVDPIYE